MGTGSPEIILTALDVIFIVGIKCAPTRVGGVGGFETFDQKYIEDEIIGVVYSYGEQHVESLGEITYMSPAAV